MSANPEIASSPLLEDAFHEDPARVLAELRAKDPVHYIPGIDAWMICRHDDIRQLFIDPRVTNDQRFYQHYQLPPEGSTRRWLSEHGFFSAPEDEHQRMRNLVTKSFTPRSVKRIEDQIRDVVESFASKLRGRTGVVDLVDEYTNPIPNTVISRMTGIPPFENEERRFRELMHEVISGISPLLDDEAKQKAEKAIVELCDWVRELAEQRMQSPQEDMISDLLAKVDEDDPATIDEIILVISGLVAAGSETTSTGSMLGLRTLFRNPDQMQRLREDRSLMPNAVRELLRYDFGPVGLPRYALEDFELRGRAIRKGQLLMLNFMGAHRDPEVFPDPDRFDIGRDTRDLTIFGRGAHYCIGANLAQSEMGIILDAALDVIPEDAQLLDDEICYERASLFSRMTSLPVDFG
jgi:cytochrome P450